MRILTTLIVSFLVFTQTVYTQERAIDLNTALVMAKENNIDLQKSILEMKYKEAELSEAKRLPNPIFTYSREDLKSNGTQKPR